MKRITTFLFAFLITASLSLAAQEPATKDQTANDKSVQKAENKEAKASSKGKAMSLTGWVKDQDGKTVFINDKDKQACKGQNSCKGKGGCKTGDNGCKGKNSCKGKGGCRTDGKPMEEEKKPS